MRIDKQRLKEIINEEINIFFSGLNTEQTETTKETVKMKTFDKLLSEIAYNEYAKDESLSARQKVNHSIKEADRALRLVERGIRHGLKMKTEAGVNKEQYWKSTGKSLMKLKERVSSIASMIDKLENN